MSSNTRDIILLGSEIRRLEHNSYHHTRHVASDSEKSTRRNQYHFPGTAQAGFINDTVARFYCFCCQHGPLTFLCKEGFKVSGLLSRSGRQCFSPIKIGVFRSCSFAFLSLPPFAIAVFRPVLAPTTEMSGHLAPTFHLLGSCCFSASGQLGTPNHGIRHRFGFFGRSRLPASTISLQSYCKSIDGRRLHQQ